LAGETRVQPKVRPFRPPKRPVVKKGALKGEEGMARPGRNTGKPRKDEMEKRYVNYCGRDVIARKGEKRHKIARFKKGKGKGGQRYRRWPQERAIS